MENMMKLSPMIVQALSNKVKKSELLQLPHIEESQLRHFATKKVLNFKPPLTCKNRLKLIYSITQRNIFTIKQFVTMKDADRRSVLRYLSDEQYEDIMRVCSSYPNIEMNVDFKSTSLFDVLLFMFKKANQTFNLKLLMTRMNN